jgi:hypothetical protein
MKVVRKIFFYEYQGIILLPRGYYVFMLKRLLALPFLLSSLLALLMSCSSYDKFKREADEFEIPSIIVNADLNRTWAAVVGTMKRFEIEQQNMDSGVIRTKWIDNTLALNFTDSFGTTDKIKSARFKMLISVASAGANKKKPQTKVTIYKRQLVENDAFQGWKEVETDYITEKTLLYRIERVVSMDETIERLQREKESRMIKNFEGQTNNDDQQQQLVPDIAPAPTPQSPSPETPTQLAPTTDEAFEDETEI